MRDHLYRELIQRCQYQDQRWGGPTHDDKHNERDWVFFIAKYLGRAVTWPFDGKVFREAMLDVAALAIQAMAWTDRLPKDDGSELKQTTEYVNDIVKDN